MGRSPKEELFLQNSHYSARYKLYLTNIWPDKLIITTIVICMPKTYMQKLESDLKQFFLVKNNLLTSVHNDADVYNRVIGIALLKAFSCAKISLLQILHLTTLR